MGKGLTILEAVCVLALGGYGYAASMLGNAKNQDQLDRAYLFRHISVAIIGIVFVAVLGITAYAFAHRAKVLKYRRQVRDSTAIVALARIDTSKLHSSSRGSSVPCPSSPCASRTLF